MIAVWMLGATVGALLLAIAAHALEAALRAWRRPLRGVWVAALAASVLVPVGGSLIARSARLTRERARVARVPNGATPGAPTRLSAFVIRASSVARIRVGMLAPLETPLRALWAITSIGTLLLVADGMRRLARARRGWDAHRIDGIDVLVADDVGPAVVGLRRPAIVLPRWALTLEPSLQALILRHETEHVRVGDPALLTLGALAVVAMPWNLALWWQLRRLRAATELDCDARVLAAHRDRARYGLLLLAVAQRRSMPFGRLGGAPALAESSSDLSRRIDAMRAPRSRHRVFVSAAAVTVAAFGVAGAIAACGVSRDVMAPNATRSPAPQVLELPPVHAELDSAAVRARANGASITAVAGGADSVDAMLPAGDGTLRPGKVPASTAARLTAARGDSTKTRAALPMGPRTVDGPYFEFQVERPVVQAPGSPGPRYPETLKQSKVEGTVMAQFVVDTAGHAMPETFKVLRSDHDLFTQAVKSALPNMTFYPALVGGRAVRQLVQQPFQFSLTK
jgi:TonB family protein